MRIVTEHATIPVIKHDAGVCHIYVDDERRPGLAERICLNAKDPAAVDVQCHGNAAGASKYRENLAGRIHRQVGGGQSRSARLSERPVRLSSAAKPASERRLRQRVSGSDPRDQGREEHRRSDGAHRALRLPTHRSDRHERITRKRCDSFAKSMRVPCLVNASTRLNDGYQFGSGCRNRDQHLPHSCTGPMGLEELTCSKFIVLGSGQLRE